MADSHDRGGSVGVRGPSLPFEAEGHSKADARQGGGDARGCCNGLISTTIIVPIAARPLQYLHMCVGKTIRLFRIPTLV